MENDWGRIEKTAITNDNTSKDTYLVDEKGFPIYRVKKEIPFGFVGKKDVLQ